MARAAPLGTHPLNAPAGEVKAKCSAKERRFLISGCLADAAAVCFCWLKWR